MVMASVCVVAIIALGTADTIGRLAGRPLLGAVEMTESLLAATIFLALPYAQRRHQHVVVDIIVQRFSESWRNIAYLAATILMLGAVCLLLAQSFQGTVHSWRIGEVSAGYIPVPIWLAKILATTGLAVAAIETLRQIAWALLWPDLALAERGAAGGEGAPPEQS
jgi:TRAP-type mannitol/chloroaromatic compound transport system permease small subunit